MTTALDYVRQKSWEFRIDSGKNGPEIVVKRCPYCTDAGNHFYLNMESGVFQCFKCRKTGGLFTLKSDLGDIARVTPLAPPPDPVVLSTDEADSTQKAHEALLQDKEMLLWLSDRKFSEEAIRYFKLGISFENNKKWVIYPYFDRQGKLRNVKKRDIRTKEFLRRTGGDSILFNEKALDLETDSIIVCEGESDTIALWSQGITNVVGVTTGAQGINNEWIAQLDKYHKIYLAYDNDLAGYEGSYKIGHRLGLERCFKLDFPTEINDVNDYFKAGHSPFDFKYLLETAKLMDVQYVNHISTEVQKQIRHIRQLEEGASDVGLTLPYPSLDKLINKFQPGDLIILAARPGVGKSSFAFNFLYHYASKGIPSLLFTLEMRPERIVPRLAARHLGIDSRLVNTMEHMSKVFQDFQKIALYTAYTYKKPNFDFCAETIRASVRRYGIKFIVFDNLHFLIRSLQDQTKEVSLVVQSFKLLAEELELPILVVARPRKTAEKKIIISNIDLKDSSDVEADADIVILLHRDFKVGIQKNENYPKEGVFEERMLVRVSKCRYAPGGDTWLFMKDDICKVEEEETRCIV